MQRKSSSLNILLAAAYGVPADKITEESTTNELLRILQLGDSTQARFFLDGLELRFGVWEHAELASVHLLVLFCENDLSAARFFVKRSRRGIFDAENFARQAYEKMWSGDEFSALDILLQKQSGASSSALQQRATELLIAKLRAKMLAHFQHAYTRVSTQQLARCLGCTDADQVRKFCEMAPNSTFSFEGDFVSIASPSPATTETNEAKKIENLVRVILSLQSEPNTFISHKTTTTAS